MEAPDGSSRRPRICPPSFSQEGNFAAGAPTPQPSSAGGVRPPPPPPPPPPGDGEANTRHHTPPPLTISPFFFLNDRAPTEISTLPLPDALPIKIIAVGPGIDQGGAGGIREAPAIPPPHLQQGGNLRGGRQTPQGSPGGWAAGREVALLAEA